ncbi:hypothetical protein [Pseudomonas sp. CGJS7]|uniref:hypothetical protein n=1 Tax=Pseudomonas sp. CGJS7 TaxID=3109348 RepID=UPI003009E173
MKSPSLLGALAVACFGFAAAFTAAPLQAGPPCQFCLDRLDACLDRATTPSQESACISSFHQCRAGAVCP